VDFSIILLLPIGAAIAFVTCITAALRGKTRPRLIWPLAVTTLLALPVFAGPPFRPIAEWAFYILIVLLWSAIGTTVGALGARIAIKIAQLIKS
jgi:high-affinity K+ transport system ATPase subunit B